jgi:hypothetical protein
MRRRKSGAWLALGLLAMGAGVGAWAQEGSSPGGSPGVSPSLVLGGSVLEQAYGSYDDSGLTASGDFGYGSSTTLELNIDAKGEKARASASLEAAVLDGEAAQAAWLYRPYDPVDELFVPETAQQAASMGGPDLLLAARVRTLYAKLDEDWVSILAGRQVINYERGAIWSPTDLFTRLDLSGLSPERLGSDALRLVFPFGATGGLDLAAAPGADPAAGLYSARLSGLVMGVDGALTAARDGEAATSSIGADFKADLGAGIYGDLIYSRPDSGSSGSLRAAGGADWSFGDFIVAAEYYYNGGGVAADLLFPDAQNLYADLTWRVSEFLNVSSSAIWDLGGQSGDLLILGSWSAAQNAGLSAYAKLLWGQSSLSQGLQLGATLELSF